MGVSKTQKLSGIQKQVLSLYRGFLRTARSKTPENRTQIESLVSAEFRRNSQQIDRKNFLHIEYLLRRGKKQLDQLKTVDSVRISLEAIKLATNNFGRRGLGKFYKGVLIDLDEQGC